MGNCVPSNDKTNSFKKTPALKVTPASLKRQGTLYSDKTTGRPSIIALESQNCSRKPNLPAQSRVKHVVLRTQSSEVQREQRDSFLQLPKLQIAAKDACNQHNTIHKIGNLQKSPRLKNQEKQLQLIHEQVQHARNSQKLANAAASRSGKFAVEAGGRGQKHHVVGLHNSHKVFKIYEKSQTQSHGGFSATQSTQLPQGQPSTTTDHTRVLSTQIDPLPSQEISTNLKFQVTSPLSEHAEFRRKSVREVWGAASPDCSHEDFDSQFLADVPSEQSHIDTSRLIWMLEQGQGPQLSISISVMDNS